MKKERIQQLWFGVRDRGLIFVLVAAGSFLVYYRTLAPGILPGDSGEFQFAAWRWTLVHPTGYPLYLLLGGLWQHLVPLGEPAYRLNLLSAVFSALAIGLSYRVFHHATHQRGAAAVGALALAFSRTFWSQATESEVYALNSLFVALLAWWAIRWQEKRQFKYAAAWALTFGLALTHHRTIILLVPGFAAFFADSLWDRRAYLRAIGERFRPAGSGAAGLTPSPIRRDLVLAGLVVVPLILYAYIPLRAGATPYARLEVSSSQTIVTFENSPAGWLSQLTGNTFASDLGFTTSSVNSIFSFPGRLIQEFNPLGVALGVLGFFFILYRRQLALAALGLFGFLAVVLFGSAYHIGDIADFYTPAYFFFALFIAAGAGGILTLARRLVHSRTSLLPVITLLILLAALPLNNLFANFVGEDRSLHGEWEKRWREIVNSPIPASAILLSNDRDEMTPFWYLQLVEGKRPDLLGLFPSISPGPGYSNLVRLIDSISGSGRPLYMIKDLPGLEVRYHLEPAGDGLVRVTSVPWKWEQQSGASIENKLKIAGFSVVDPPQPGTAGQVAVYWQPLVPLGRDYTTSLQLLNEAGQKVAQGEDHKPGEMVYPTSLWQPGETLQDVFSVRLPADLAPGVYDLGVKVYAAGSDEALGALTRIGKIDIP